MFQLPKCYDPDIVKPFKVPGSLSCSEPLYHTPPANCAFAIRGSRRSLLPAFLNMCSADILVQVTRDKIRNAFPVFVVRKSDGSGRVIYDCHKWTPAYSSPPLHLPRPTDLVNVVFEHTHCTKLDLRDEFYHLKLAPFTCQWFSIKCENSYFRFKCLPMGWTLSPLLMQTAMRCELSALLHDICSFLVYYNDIIRYAVADVSGSAYTLQFYLGYR